MEQIDKILDSFSKKCDEVCAEHTHQLMEIGARKKDAEEKLGELLIGFGETMKQFEK